MKKLLNLTGLGFLLAALFLVAQPVRAGEDVDQRIKNLEDELARLKGEQMELKKDATAAAAALPTFTYRPGNGLMIQDADRYWSIRFGLEAHFRSEFPAGHADAGRTKGEVFGRRFRPYIWYCISDCFTEMEVGWDMDGFGTGNGKNSTATDVGSVMQRGTIYFHFERLNPWLPRFAFGMDDTGIGVMPYRQNDGSTTGPFAEYDLLSHNNGFNTGRPGVGYILEWDNLPLGPGRITRLQGAMATIGEGDDGLSSFKDIGHGFSTGIWYEPFTRQKEMFFAQGLGISFNAWFCDASKMSVAGSARTSTQEGCARNRVQDDGDAGKQTLFDSGDMAGKVKGWSQFYMPGIGWRIGPYMVAGVLGFQHYGWQQKDAGVGSGQYAKDWRIMHQLFVWSPKGPLTGSYDTPGTVQVAFGFNRADYYCGHPVGTTPCASGNEFSRNRVLVREWDLWYFLNPRNSVGINWEWFDAHNLRSGANNAGDNLGVFSGTCVNGKAPKGSCGGGQWLNVLVNWRYWF